MSSEYNGYTNKATWNVALWLMNDQRLYSIAMSVENYAEFMSLVYPHEQKTHDGYDYNDPTINVHELNEMVWDL